jgi:hypothetical protein
MIDGQDREDIEKLLDTGDFFIAFNEDDTEFTIYPHHWPFLTPDHPDFEEYFGDWEESGQTFKYPRQALTEVMIACLGGDWEIS